MGYTQYTTPEIVTVEPTNLLLSFSPRKLQISLKSSELKTTQITFRGCRVHFIRQPFSK